MIVLFFDTETTGFKKDRFIPEIVQIGAIVQDTLSGRVLAELNVICKPNGPIPEIVSQIHGITDELAASYGVYSQQAELMFTVLAAMAERVVAHNIQFDLGIIKDVWPVANDVLSGKDAYCTMRHATDVIKLPPGRYHGGYFSKYKPPKLIEAYQYFFGIDFDNAHDAMADVRACRDVYFALETTKETL